MPLLKKKVFEKRSVPDFLRDDEEVFYCEITNEIFRDYEEFSERMFLCNSMVWTCSMTGKQNLTYQEAQESEEHAKQILKEFPNELKTPILFISSKTQKTSFGEMAEDVFLYIKDRYFIGENLEACFTGDTWKHCHVLSVIPPAEEEIQNAQQKNKNNSEKHFGSPSNLYKYEIEHLDAEDMDISEIMIVDNTQLRRRKAVFSRDKCKLFIKQYVEQDEKGMFIIKPSVMEEFGVMKLKWDQVFSGPEPKFEPSKKLDSPTNKKRKQKQETLAKYLQKNGVLPTTNNNKERKNNNLLEQMKKREDEFKKNKLLREEEKLAEKQRKKEESLMVAQYLKEWSKTKEDLELENQAVLPIPTPVKCRIPEDYFGDTIMVLDFVDKLSKFLSTKDFFPGGFSFEIIERALVQKEVAGPLTDIIQMLLTAIFNVQEEESSQYRTVVENAKEINEEDLPDNLSLTDATHLATLASNWSSKYQGMPLSRLPLYSLTVSEVLRLHLLSSGARINDTGARWRYAQRGGYTSEDDPGLYLRLHRPHILKALAVHNVVELTIGDKLQVIRCLIDQLLTYADVRDIIEERLETTKRLKMELRSTQKMERRREAEFTGQRAKAKRESKGDPKGIAEQLQRLNDDNEIRQQQNTRKIEKLIKAINEAQNVMGYDRAHRKYLRIDSVPAIFVNCEDEHVGKCLDALVKQYPDAVNVDRKQLLSHIRELQKDNGKKSPKKVNGARSPTKNEPQPNLDELLMCSSDPDTCIVHSVNVKRTKWSFFHDEQQIEQLLASLNKRGKREGELMEVVKNDKENIISIITQTPVHQLNPDVEKVKEEEDLKVLRNSKKNKDRYEDANLGYPLDMQPEDVMHNALIDNILEMEEKISAGNLGSIRVKNRDEWRNCLQNRDYDKLERTIIKNENGKYAKLKKGERKNGSRPSTPDISVKVEVRDYQDPGRFVMDGEEVVENGDTELGQPDDVKEAVRCLAVALTQVAEGIDARYLKKPLGHGDVTKADLTNRKTEYDVLDKWEQSLLSSTSFSQVFLHYGTLDSCVMWSRSALLARCRICRRQKDSENMLLCDSCNLGHHLYCLKPKLTAIPKGDWFCDKCKKEKEQEAKLLSPEPTPQKKRKIFKEEEVDEEEEVTEEQSGDEEEVEEEESSDEEMDVEEEPSEIKMKIELCKMCGSGGELIACEKCSENYHIECCEPPLRRAPRGQWTCHNCKKEDVHYTTNDKDADSGDEVIQSRRTHRRENGRDDLPLHNAALQELLSDVMKQDDAWAFLKPVQKIEVPDYYDVITKPMDFGKIKNKLNMGDYNEDHQVMSDVAQVFQNCSIYNQSDSEVFNCGVRLMQYFVKKAKELGLRVPCEMDDTDDIQPKKRRRIK